MHRRLWGLLVAVLVLTPVGPARATVPVAVIEGRGWGHGVGMAQDGAFWMAKAGAATPDILGHFYPGTSLGKVSGGGVRVLVFNGQTVSIAFPEGGRIDERGEGTAAPGFPIRLSAGGTAWLRIADGRITVDQLNAGQPTAATATTTTTRPSSPASAPASRPRESSNVVGGPGLLPSTTTSTTTARPADPTQPAAAAPAVYATDRPIALTPTDGGGVTLVERQRTYRGFIDVTASDHGVRLVNQLAIDQYLRGMGEVRDPSWPAAALRSQAIVARTYALRAMDKAGEICDTARCQVYLGRQAEYPAMDKAVAATAGQVLVFNRALASAVYSANGGGHSASREEGFGVTGGDYPYLRPTPYETQDPMPWSVSIALTDVAARLGHQPVSDVRVTGAGPSGRALEVSLIGPQGTRSVSGLAFASALGLNSTMFTVRIGTADIAPSAPTGGSVLQAPPDDVGLAAATTDDGVSLHAAALQLPDRPTVGRAASASHHRSLSAVKALAELLLAVVVLVGAGWRRRPGVTS